MARGQHHAAGLYPLTAAHHAGYGVPVQQQLCHPTAEPHFAAAGGDCPADGGHDTGQPVGTDMRMGFIEYRLVGTVEDERTERLAVISALLAPGKELAVGKGTRTSFAEGIVGVGVEPAVAVQFCHVAAAYRHLRPRSRMTGRYPDSMSRSAQKRPAGPPPTMTTSSACDTSG